MQYMYAYLFIYVLRKIISWERIYISRMYIKPTKQERKWSKGTGNQTQEFNTDERSFEKREQEVLPGQRFYEELQKGVERERKERGDSEWR